MTFYNANIPLVNTTFDQWQILLQNNFTSMDDTFSVNHVDLQDPLIPGNHTIVQLIEQESGTGIQTNIGDFAIFTRNVVEQTDQVFMQYEGNANEFQYTNYQIYQVPDIKDGKGNVVQKTYFTTLPGKLIVYFGSLLSATSSEPEKVFLKLSPSVAKNIVSVNVSFIASIISLTAVQTAVGKQGDLVTGIDFKYNTNSPNFVPFYYLIIGNM